MLRPIRDLDRFYSTLESLRNCDGSGTGSEYARTNAIHKHLVALLEAIISADKFPGATVNDLLNKSWGDFEKFADGFVQYPSLVAVLDDCTKLYTYVYRQDDETANQPKIQKILISRPKQFASF